MNKLCENCDTRIRLKMCIGKEGEFRFCFRKVGSTEGLEESITTFNDLKELIEKSPTYFENVKVETLKIQWYDIGTALLIGEWVDGGVSPVGFIII